MELGLYERIEADVLDHVNSAELIGYGEPFMAKNFMRMFDACVERGIHILTTTNGILLRKEELADKVVRNDVTLVLSIDGATKETFEFVRPYVRWEGIIKTLEMLKQCREKAGDAARFRLRFNFVAMHQNLGDLLELVRLAHRYGASQILVLPLGSEEDLELMENQSPFHHPAELSRAFMEAIPLAARLNVELLIPKSFTDVIIDSGETGLGGSARRWVRRVRLGYHYVRKHGVERTRKRFVQGVHQEDRKAAVTHCNMPWKDSYFASDGTVFPCCIMQERLGNMGTQSWAEIWNGAPYRNLRRTVHSWNPSDVCRNCGLPTGINGGNERQYTQFFEKFRAEALALDDPNIDFAEGFHKIERNKSGAPSHIWMTRRGTFTIPHPTAARFLRIRIIPRVPVPETNPGMATLDGDQIEPFDNTCNVLHFPIPQGTSGPLTLRLEMENSHCPEGDGRELGLAIAGLELLH